MQKIIKIKEQEVTLESEYSPIQDSEDAYMSPKQRAYFKVILTEMLEELRLENIENDKFFQDAEQKMNLSDEIDFANYENEISTKTRTRERNINKEKKIIESLKSIETGEYGYCKATGEEIGIKRLLARPFTNLSIEAQEKKDFHKKEFEHALSNENGAKLYSEDE